MEEVVGGAMAYRMGARVPLMRREADGAASIAVAYADRARPLVPRESIDCTKSDNANLCEKPYGASGLTLPITLGIAIPLVCLVSAMVYLHRRNVKKQRREDATDPHKSLDFGLGDNVGGKGGKRKSAFFGAGEKPGHRNNQLSMDMNLSSPYLLPPGVQSSRDSLQSLARTLKQNEDPYRPVYAASDAGSIRSFKKPARENSLPKDGLGVPLPRKGSFPLSPTSPVESIPPRYEASHADVIAPPPPAPVKDSIPYPEDKSAIPMLAMPSVPELQEPAPATLAKPGYQAIPSSPRSPLSPSGAVAVENNGYQSLSFDFTQDEQKAATREQEPVPVSMPAMPEEPEQQPAVKLSPPVINSLPASPRPVHQTAPTLRVDTGASHDGPLSAPIMEDRHGYPAEEYPAEERGRSQHRRQSSEYPQENNMPGLDIPQQDRKRLSVGFRPLPPDELIESEDPETRANRIRSFYKEYFDEKDAARNTVYQSQQNYHEVFRKQQQNGPQYYEDYDQSYLGGDAAYYDPDTNQFVMPYSQPVARRAMTPPPSGSRLPGPRSGPRPHAGSVGGMSMPGGRGPPRPGSAASNGKWGPGPRPGSSASGQWNRPRAGSAMSAPRKPMPPPSILTTLPNPSKLRDDSFAIMNALDFAPPSGFKDQAAGRSQSPGGGERRAYQAPSHVHSPLVSAFDEMAPLPSPHLLRKSGTFTGLDFAPPRKFKDADTMSDAGSIRSNRSGISAAQLGAIRNGAGRVSRLPGDTVFSQAQTNDTLKPSWGMRD